MDRMTYIARFVEACKNADAAFEMNDALGVVNALTEIDALRFLVNDV